MLTVTQITQEEKRYVRELAKKQLEYASLPVMQERKRLWIDHNDLNGEIPLIVIETDTFQNDLMPSLQCKNDEAKHIEYQLLKNIINHELVDDDKIVPDFFIVNWEISRNQYGVDVMRDHGVDRNGRDLGFKFVHPITDLERDFHLLKPSTFSVNRYATVAYKIFVEEIIGDILPVVIKNNSLTWDPAPSGKIVELMGLEAMMFAMIDCPDKLHALYRYLTDNIKAFIRWQEQEGLLTLNNGNDYAGAGSYGFTTQLPTEDCKKTGRITSKDLWGNMNSQETVNISPMMYGEFTAPYYQELSELFGLTYYGCCEPVDGIWNDYISKLHNLRKVSISPWCNEAYMGEMLRDNGVIYSRKPSPNYMGIGGTFDEEAFASHIIKTLVAAKDCHLEFICRDVYSLSGDTTKPNRAVKIIRHLIEQYR